MSTMTKTTPDISVHEPIQFDIVFQNDLSIYHLLFLCLLIIFVGNIGLLRLVGVFGKIFTFLFIGFFVLFFASPMGLCRLRIVEALGHKYIECTKLGVYDFVLDLLGPKQEHMNG